VDLKEHGSGGERWPATDAGLLRSIIPVRPAAVRGGEAATKEALVTALLPRESRPTPPSTLSSFLHSTWHGGWPLALISSDTYLPSSLSKSAIIWQHVVSSISHSVILIAVKNHRYYAQTVHAFGTRTLALTAFTAAATS
jgi:hypothetical protein